MRRGSTDAAPRPGAFIASGFEHSVVNMTLFSIALMAEHPASVTIGGMGWNLLWVTIGNIIGVAGIMGVGYWLASRSTAAGEPAPTSRCRMRKPRELIATSARLRVVHGISG
jgi:Formate/nitrite transporter